ncbi:pol polyprotein, partial [Vairimorpha apis BRL 01]
KTYNNNKIFNNKQNSSLQDAYLRLMPQKQNQFESIVDYYDEIEKGIEIYKVFHRGLGHFIYLEILKQNMQKAKEGILLEGKLSKIGIYMVNDNNALDYALKNNLKKDMKEVKTLELNGRIGGIDKIITIYDGSNENYICEAVIKNLKLNTYEIKAINVKFGDSACETTNIKVKEKIEIGEDEFIVEFYVLKRLPVAVIIGLSFLEGNYCADKSSTTKFFNQKLSEILNNSSTISNDEINKILKFYTNVNNNFKSINATPYMQNTTNKNQLDLANGFNQLNINEVSNKYTTFMLLRNLYQYKRVPFGIKLRTKICKWYISEILYDIYNCFVYIDVLMIHYSQYNIYRGTDRFLQKELDVLGYKIDKEGIYYKIKSFIKKDVQRLMGIINWYRKFIPNLSTKLRRYTLSREMKQMIEDIKHITQKKFILECDALDIGLGSVLRNKLQFIRIALIDYKYIEENKRGQLLKINIKKLFTTIRILKEIHKLLDHKGAKIHNFINNKEYHIVAKEKGERISMDIYGSFETSDSKNGDVNDKGYILSITDVYSRYTKIYFFKQIKTQNIIDALNGWNSIFNTPRIAISDNGKYSNDILEKLNKTLSFILTINKDKENYNDISTSNNFWYQHSLQKIIKVGKRRYWVMLEFDNGWTNVRNIRLIMRCSIRNYNIKTINNLNITTRLPINNASKMLILLFEVFVGSHHYLLFAHP